MKPEVLFDVYFVLTLKPPLVLEALITRLMYFDFSKANTSP